MLWITRPSDGPQDAAVAFDEVLLDEAPEADDEEDDDEDEEEVDDEDEEDSLLAGTDVVLDFLASRESVR